MAMTSEIMGVRTDDVLAHVLVFSGAGCWALGIIAQLFLKRFVDVELLRNDPDLKKHAFRASPPRHLLTPFGRRLQTASYGALAVGAGFIVITGIYVHVCL